MNYQICIQSRIMTRGITNGGTVTTADLATKVSSTGGTITGTLNITGNLTVQGTIVGNTTPAANLATITYVNNTVNSAVAPLATSSSVSSLSSTVSTNTSNIATNISNLNTVTSNVSTLQTTVTSQGTTLSTASSNITALQGRATTDETNITANTSAITALQTRAGVDESAITALQTRATTDEGNLTTATGNITTLQGNVSSLQTSSTANGSAITALQTRATTDEAAITALQSTTASQGTLISNNTSGLANNTTAIATLQTRATTDEGYITTLQSTVSTQGTAITTNASGLSTLQTTVSGQGTSITALQNRATADEALITSTVNAAITGLSSTTQSIGTSGTISAASLSTSGALNAGASTLASLTVSGGTALSGSLTGGAISGTSINSSGTVSSSGLASLNSAAVAGNATVGGTLGVTGVATFAASPVFSANTITGSGGVSTLPSTTGTLALTSQIPSLSGYVTTTTLNNNTLPASVSTLTVSGNSQLGVPTVGSSGNTTTNMNLVAQNSSWQMKVNGSTSASPSANNSIEWYNTDTSKNVLVAYQTGALKSVNNTLDDSTGNMIVNGGNLTVYKSGGTKVFGVTSSNVVTTANSTLDDGSGNATVNGSLTVNGSTVPLNVLNAAQADSTPMFFNLGRQLASNKCAQLTFNLGTSANSYSDSSFGLYLYGGQAYLSVGHSSCSLSGGNVQLGTVGTSNTVSTPHNTLDDGSGNMSSSGHLTVGGYVQATASSTIPAYIFTSATAVTNPSNTGLWQHSDYSVRVWAAGGLITTNSTGAVRNTLDDGAGNAVLAGNVTVGGNSVLISGGAASLTLPASSGSIALVSQIPTVYLAYGAITNTTNITLVNQTGGFSFSSNAVYFPSKYSPIGSYAIEFSYSNTLAAGATGIIGINIFPTPAGSNWVQTGCSFASVTNGSTSSAIMTATGMVIVSSGVTYITLGGSGFSSTAAANSGGCYTIRGLI
jgi:hypothetical protein